MSQGFRRARINIKFLFILLGVVVLLGVSLVTARHVRRRVLSARDLAAGEAAYAARDWNTAFNSYSEYLGRNLEDIQVLKKYAHAGLSAQPLDRGKLNRAIGAYRRVIQLDPGDQEAYEKLARIYRNTGNLSDLAYIAQKRLEHAPDNRQATLWLVEALAGQDKIDEATQLLDPFLEELRKDTTKHEEYVQGCIRMSQIIQYREESATPALALEWLNKAATHDPNSAESQLLLARYYRESQSDQGDSGAIHCAQAESSLQAIAAQDFVPPLVHLAAGSEWMALGRYQQAENILREAELYSQEVLEEHVFDFTQWSILKYQLGSELAWRQGELEKAAQLSTDILANLTDKRYRFDVLPLAVKCYLAANANDQARQAFDEYMGLVHQQGNAGTQGDVIFLEALVAEAEGQWGTVIDVLEPESIDNAAQPQYWRLLASAYSKTGNTQAATRAMENHLRFFPQDVAVSAQLVQSCLRQGEWARAVTLAKRVEAVDPNSVAIGVLRMEAEMAQVSDQDPDTRIQTLRRLSAEVDQWIQTYPERIDIWLLRARITQQREGNDQAEQVLLRAVETCPESLPAEIQLARLYAATERPDEAKQVLQAACQHHGGSVEPWLVLAGLYGSMQNHEAARDCLKKGINEVPEAAQKRRLSLSLAIIELAQGDRHAGINLLKEMAAQDEQDIQARARLLEIPEIRKDPEAARALIQELRAAEGDSGSLWRYHQATLWLEQDDWRSREQDIVSHLQHCIDHNPRWALPRMALISFYQRTRDVAQIEDLCRRVLTQNPQARDVAEQLVMLLEQQGRFVEAEDIIKNYAREDDFSRNWQIRTALRGGDLSQAIDDLKRKAAADKEDVVSRILLARLVYRQTGDMKLAFAFLEEAKAIDPNSTAVVAARASILNAEGQSDSVQQLLDAHVKETDSFNAYQLRGTYAVEQGRPQDAESDYRKLMAFAGMGAQPYALVADYYQTMGKLSEMVGILRDGLNAVPGDPALRRRLMLALFQQGAAENRAEADALLSALQEEKPEDAELIQIRALQQWHEGDPEDLRRAQALLEQAIQLDPTAVESYLMLITMDVQKQDYETARSRVLQALGANPGDAALLAMRARVELGLGNTSMAIHLAQLALQKAPQQARILDVLVYVADQGQNPGLLRDIQALLDTRIQEEPAGDDFRLLKARTQVALEQSEQAIAELETYTESDAGRRSLAVTLELARLYMVQGQLGEAEQWIQRAAALNPQSSALLAARINWATQLHEAGQSERAATVFQELLTIDPDNIVLINNYAWLLQDGLQRYDEALVLANRGLVLLPGNPNLLDTRGVILSKMEGRQTEAKADFARLVEISNEDKPRQAQSLLKLGRICMQLNELNQAKQHLRQALAIDRDTPVFTEEQRQEIAELLVLDGR